MNIVEATQSYETWLRSKIPVVEKDLAHKHQMMSDQLFPFFRATYYRWIQRFNEACPELCTAPTLLAVGDLHVENFGTWRDAEGRLVWGINDFDEAYGAIPYTNDLVRLIASALIALDGSGLQLWSEPKRACKAVVSGYLDALRGGGAAYVLAEGYQWLRRIAVERLKQPAKFWDQLNRIPTFEGEAPLGVKGVLSRSLPRPDLQYRLMHRVAGLGSLGRPRFVAIAEFEGGLVAREAKTVVASAHEWFRPTEGPSEVWPDVIDQKAVRCHDPFRHIEQPWIVRRLAPDCSRIELSDLPKEHDELKLLYAMAFECGNVHLGSAPAKAKAKGEAEHGAALGETEAVGADGSPEKSADEVAATKQGAKDATASQKQGAENRAAKERAKKPAAGAKEASQDAAAAVKQASQSEIERHLLTLPKGWLLDAAEAMLSTVKKDWKEWRKYQKTARAAAASGSDNQSPKTGPANPSGH